MISNRNLASPLKYKHIRSPLLSLTPYIFTISSQTAHNKCALGVERASHLKYWLNLCPIHSGKYKRKCSCFRQCTRHACDLVANLFLLSTPDPFHQMKLTLDSLAMLTKFYFSLRLKQRLKTNREANSLVTIDWLRTTNDVKLASHSQNT